MIIGKIKNLALWISGASAIVLGFLAQWLLSSRRQLKKENEELQADNEFKNHVAEKDVDIEEQTVSRTVDLANEIEANRIPDAFDPGKLRRKRKT